MSTSSSTMRIRARGTPSTYQIHAGFSPSRRGIFAGSFRCQQSTEPGLQTVFIPSAVALLAIPPVRGVANIACDDDELTRVQFRPSGGARKGLWQLFGNC